MTNGSAYLIDVDGVNTNAVVYSAETDTAVEPGSAVIGHAIVPANFNRSVDSRIYSKRTDVSICGCASPEAMRESSPRRQEAN